MSDDEYLGAACWCVPRRPFALVVAGALSAYGIISACRLVTLCWPIVDPPPPTRCSGPSCFDVGSCHGMQEATYHVQQVVQILGSMAFGLRGLFGFLGNRAENILHLALFLAAMAVLVAVLALGDCVYTVACDAYPYHLVREALLWPLPDEPVSEGVKREVREVLAMYPVDLVNVLSHLQVWRLYLCVELLVMALWAYAAHEVFLCAHRMGFGAYGLGPNFSLGQWREDILEADIREALLKGDLAGPYLGHGGMAQGSVRNSGGV